MPGEGRLPHPEVQVGRVHTADLHIVILVDPVKDGPELLNVPNLTIKKSNISNRHLLASGSTISISTRKHQQSFFEDRLKLSTS